MRKSVCKEIKERLNNERKEMDLESNVLSKDGFRKLLNCIKKLQYIVATAGKSGGKSLSLDLPRIVTVGSQSVGKSSVIEALMGCSILPRGEGIVTRCPLVITLEQLAENRETTITFEHTERSFTDVDEARREIVAETERKAPKALLSKDPIFLKVASSNVVNLTIVDLPGITKVPIRNQPEDVEQLVTDLIYDFVKESNTIILAISAANADLAVSDALKVARKVDPSGSRTIGVITKCDLVDDENVLIDIIQNRIYSLSKGYIGVICPPEEELEELSYERSRQIEEEIFKNLSNYDSIKQRCGIRRLSLILNDILIKHIKHTLPTIRKQLDEKRLSLLDEIRGYGLDTQDLNPLQKKGKAFEILSNYCKKYEGFINGGVLKFGDQSLTGGARVLYIFNTTMNDMCNSCSPEYDELKVRLALRNANGVKSSFFPVDDVLECLIRSSIEQLRVPGLRSVDLVYEELVSFHETCLESEVRQLPMMERLIKKVVFQELKSLLQPTKDMINNIVDMELAYLDIVKVCGASTLESIWTEDISSKKIIIPLSYPPKSHNDEYSSGTFLKELQNNEYTSMVKLPRDVQITEQKTDEELQQLNLIKKTMGLYHSRVTANVLHYFPRVIMHYMVYKSVASLQNKLVQESENEDLENLLLPSQSISEARHSCITRLDAVEKAQDLLDDLLFSNE